MTTTSIAAQAGSWKYASTAKTESKAASAGASSSGSTPSAKTDTVTLSGREPPVDPKSGGTDLAALLASEGEEALKAKGKGVDLTQLQQAMKDQLLEQMRQAQTALQGAGKSSKLISDILYAVDKNEKAAEVPEEWGADKTSQRIVDFAVAFRGAAKGMTDEEFIGTIRKSIQDGFRSAKGDLKDLPGPSAKLFNDTYEASMKKLDDVLASWKKDASGAATDTSSSAAAPVAAKSASGSASSFSVVA